jgi:hypothetical protein
MDENENRDMLRYVPIFYDQIIDTILLKGSLFLSSED